ncbi:MAG: tetratricopeptide repeat protein [Bacteroidota bacterium]
MARRRNPKKKEETIVDVVEVKDQATDFFYNNRNLIFGILGALLLVAAGLWYWSHLKNTKNIEAMDAMYSAQEQFKKDSFSLALTNPGGGNYGFLDIIDNYGGTKASNLAHYYSGISYLHLGNYDMAVSYLKDFSPKGDISPILKNGALGDAYSELDDFSSAESSYRKAISAGDLDPLTPYYMKKLGMLLQYQGDNAGAKEMFSKIKDKYPNSSDGIGIEKYIARVQ